MISQDDARRVFVDEQGLRAHLFAAAWLPAYTYMTHMAVKWAIVAAELELQNELVVTALSDLAMK